jgi:lambda family phage minor tail protein L
MSESAKITAEVQKLEADALIALFVLDLTEIGGDVFRFHGENTTNGASLWFGGVEYVAMPIEARGFAFNGTEQNPMPTLSVSNVNNVIPALIREFDDLVGAKVTRLRTFAKHLDSGADPDATATFSEEIYFVNRKLAENRISVDFELASVTDVEGVMLPGRRAIANLCPWVFKGGECGYSGPNATCAKTLEACKTNHGTTAPLPFGGFPGLSRTNFTA